jgi:hypothetical protein
MRAPTSGRPRAQHVVRHHRIIRMLISTIVIRRIGTPIPPLATAR